MFESVQENKLFKKEVAAARAAMLKAKRDAQKQARANVKKHRSATECAARLEATPLGLTEHKWRPGVLPRKYFLHNCSYQAKRAEEKKNAEAHPDMNVTTGPKWAMDS